MIVHILIRIIVYVIMGDFISILFARSLSNTSQMALFSDLYSSIDDFSSKGGNLRRGIVPRRFMGGRMLSDLNNFYWIRQGFCRIPIGRNPARISSEFDEIR
jgi:hypothetical protein